MKEEEKINYKERARTIVKNIIELNKLFNTQMYAPEMSIYNNDENEKNKKTGTVR
ncbi:MAG: hypothetical protein K9M56_07010 [Victivallales bacterium]|nr:hypothetical protein [Victivallales bacterium]